MSQKSGSEKKVSPATRKTIARLRKLFQSIDTAAALQGIELAVGLDDQEVWDVLLDGVTYDPNGGLIPNKIFSGLKRNQVFLDSALIVLVAQSSHPLREEVTSLSFGWSSYQEGVPDETFPLDSIENLPNLTRLDLKFGGADYDLSPLTACVSLEKLTVSGNVVLPGLQHLKRLWASDISFEPDGLWPNLEFVEASGFDIGLLRAAAPRLRTLKGRSLSSVKGFPTLQTFVGHRCTNVEIVDCPALEEISLLHSSVTALSGVDSLRKLTVVGGGTEDWNTLADLPNLETVSITEPRGLKRFAVPPGTKVDGPLDLGGESLEDIGNCGELVDLEVLDLRDVVYPVSLETLRNASKLRVVDLRKSTGVTNIEPLVGLPELRMVAIYRSGVETVPPELKRIVSRTAYPNMKEAFDKPLPSEKSKRKAGSSKKFSAQAKKHAARLKKLLRSSEAALTMQGVELAVSLDDQEVWEVLFDGVTFIEGKKSEDAGGSANKRFGRLQPNRAFTGPKFRQWWLDVTLALLVAQSDHPLRQQVTSLQFVSSRERDLDVLPLHGIGGFPNLKKLRLKVDRLTCDLSPLAECLALEELIVEGEKDTLLPGMPSLRSLSAKDVHLDPDGFWPQLETVSLSHWRGTEANFLRTAVPQLRTLTARVSGRIVGFPNLQSFVGIVDDGEITDCPKLEEIAIRGGLKRLENVDSLRSLSLRHRSENELGFCGSFPNFQTISVTKPEGLERFAVPPGTKVEGPLDLGVESLEDLGNCGEVVDLEILNLREVVNPVSLETLRNASKLRVLDIRSSPGITDLSPLVDLPELRIIAIRESGVESVPPELGKTVSRAADPDLTKAFSKPVPSKTVKQKPIPVPENQRADWGRVESGLATSDLSTALAAVDIAGTLDPSGVEFLLTKVKMVGEKIQTRAPIRLGSPLLAPAVVARLLSYAPGNSVAAVPFRRMRKLRIEGKHMNSGLVSLSEFEQFTALEHLVVTMCTEIQFDSLSQTGIATLSLHAQTITLGELPVGLRRVLIARSQKTDLSVIGRSEVEELYLVHMSEVDLTQISSAKNLHTLRVQNNWRMSGVEALCDLPSLQSLSIRNHTFSSNHVIEHPPPALKSIVDPHAEISEDVFH